MDFIKELLSGYCFRPMGTLITSMLSYIMMVNFDERLYKTSRSTQGYTDTTHVNHMIVNYSCIHDIIYNVFNMNKSNNKITILFQL